MEPKGLFGILFLSVTPKKIGISSEGMGYFSKEVNFLLFNQLNHKNGDLTLVLGNCFWKWKIYVCKKSHTKINYMYSI